MKERCKKCGAEVSKDALVCPSCKTMDPLGQIADEAERFNEEQVLSAGEPSKKDQQKDG